MKPSKTPLVWNQDQLTAILDLYDNAPCGTLTFQEDGLLLDVNATFTNWLGYDKEELINTRTFPSLLKIGGQIFFETHFFPLIKLQGFVKEVYFDIKRKDKSLFRALINVRKIPSTKNETRIYQAIVLDVTERYKYEDELRNAKLKAEKESQAKAEFLSTISHEIRTPLNSILGVGNLLQQTLLNKAQKEYVNLLMHSSEHLLGLVNNFLDLSKIEANKLDVVKVDFNLHDLLNVIVHTFKIKATKQAIYLKIDIDDDVPKAIVGDSTKLKQVLTNLIGNAVKFTQKGGITLSVKTVQNKGSKNLINFSVTDTGIGIPEDKLSAVFKEFTQANYDLSAETGGTGLGLTICTKLLELHDSKLDVISTLGIGTTFSFAIWYTKSLKKLKQLASIKEHIKLPKFLNYNVVVVDDNPANIFITTQYLEKWNVPFSAFLNGEEVLEHLKTKSPDLILLDLQMPIMDGYDVVKKIKALHLEQMPYIVAFSASGYHELKFKITQSGFDDYLSKPFQPNELLEILHKTIDARKKWINPKPHNTSVNSITKKVKIQKQKKATLAQKESRFSTKKFKKMSEKKPEYFFKFLSSTSTAIQTYKVEFEHAIIEKSVDKLSALIHKSTMSLFYIEANRLTRLLNETKESFISQDASLNTNVKNCLSEFDFITQQLAKLNFN